MVLLAWIFCFCLLLAPATAQSWATIPFSTQSLPIALRSPYLNSWLSQGKAPSATPFASNTFWPVFWTTSPPAQIVAWYVAIRVDGVMYNVFGGQNLPHVANQTAAIITPTQTSFILQAGPVNVNSTFLSPIEPTDLVRQSMPFTYLYVDVTSADGQPHSVQLYSDISAEWLSGDRTMICNWTANINSDYISLQTQLQSPIPFAEIGEQALDTTAYLSMSKQASTTWQIGGNNRGVFNNTGVLLGTQENNFRGISDAFPTFGIAVDLGNITQTSAPSVWLLGLLRDPVVQYTNGDGNKEMRSSYFWSQQANPLAAVSFLLNDSSRALDAGNAMDAKVLADARKISSPYADMVTMSARQVMSAIDITVKKDSSGKWNTSDVKAFFKNMGSVGGPGVNSVDVLYSAFPAYLYFNPAIAGYLLSPLLEFQNSKQYALPYAAHDLGLAYPNATGNSNPHNEGIEQSANMLIMTLAHAQFTGDGALISNYYTLLRDWADYLVNNTLSPGAQTTSDGLTITNQTNLAIKGIIGIAAMAKISTFAGDSTSATHYQTVSSNYENQWQALSFPSNTSHLLSGYGSQSSSGLMYNLYSDKLLQLNVVPNSVYDAQTTFYSQNSASFYGFSRCKHRISSLISGNGSPYDWMMLAASTSSNTATRDALVLQIHNFVTAGVTSNSFPLIYDPTSAKAGGGPGR
ncbi:hypothetical protein BD410DRAFT_723660 [Rickenella mellea]|uniref:DUF1793-domain-containing protein n=1 Tax=Rickenella mellea TaxID=50990 RepID=A0A4Y7Q3S9_9AGAM|nr:hypothetical protein BD410DRAFT_723660 [Rickenella mellea]